MAHAVPVICSVMEMSVREPRDGICAEHDSAARSRGNIRARQPNISRGVQGLSST